MNKGKQSEPQDGKQAASEPASPIDELRQQGAQIIDEALQELDKLGLGLDIVSELTHTVNGQTGLVHRFKIVIQ